MTSPGTLAVAFTVSALPGAREEYFRATLACWAQVRGIRSVPVIFCIEPCAAADRCAAAALEAFPHAVTVMNSERRYGPANTRNAVGQASGTGARFTVCAEEDVLVQPDVLEFLDWAAAEYEHDEGIAAVCAERVPARPHRSHPAGPWAVTAISGFSGRAWGTWADRWAGFAALPWDAMWDLALARHIRESGRRCVFPASALARHAGMVSTKGAGRITFSSSRGLRRELAARGTPWQT